MQPPPPPPAGGSATRPRWGIVDTWPAFVLVALTLLSALASTAESDGEAASTTSTVGATLVVSILMYQVILGGWPVIVSAWKGLGVVEDWRLRFDWGADIGLGVAIAAICYVGAQAIGIAVSSVVDVGETEEWSNTSILTDNDDSLWIIGVVILVVFGAPLVEELLFRGLVQRAFDKVFGVYVAVAVSTIVFTVLHYQPDTTAAQTTMLLASLAWVGLVFGIAAARYERLGPSIIGHVVFNGVNTGLTFLL